MASDELIARIDQHLERANVLAERNERAFERNSEAFERNREAFERNREAFERNREAFERNSEVLDRAIAAFDDQREFMRELTVRSERSHARLMTEMQRGFEAQRVELHRGFAEIHEGFADQRRALLAILDRLPPPATA